MKAVWICVAALGLSGCATLTSGDDQEIAIYSVPEGATCEIWREGVALARNIETPQLVTIDRSATEIEVVCILDDYEESRVTAAADLEAATAGNILLGGVIGLVVDAASGASNSYPNEITIELTREPRQLRGVFDGQPSTSVDEPDSVPGV